MNFPFFIAKRISGIRNATFSALIVKIATTAVALSVAVMLLASSLVTGFRKEISQRIFGFTGHIQVSNFDSHKSMEEPYPVSINKSFYKDVNQLEEVSSVQVYANKVGVLKQEEEEIMEGIVLRGIGSDFDWDVFNQYMKEGEPFDIVDSTKSNNILLSQFTAKRLKAKIGDKLLAFFFQERVRYRKFTVSGIYKTGLEDYDERFALIDIKHIQKLNKWKPDEVGGVSILLKDGQQMETVNDHIYTDLLDHETRSRTVRQNNPGIFDWLELQRTNEWIIMVLMVVVAIINMITALLILILERTNMIGILKALGAPNFDIQKIFLIKAARIVLIGMFLGNLIGLGLAYIQKTFGLIQLSEESYYLSVAPVDINPTTILLINLGTFIICLFTLLIPSYLVSWINPVKSLRFD